MLSIKEVAKLTGLSTATVSRALDPRYAARVKPETRKKILEVCDSANYRPDMSGRSFVTGKSFKIGFISADPAGDCGNQLFGFFLHGAIFELQNAAYNLLILGSPHTPEQESQVINFLRSNVADGYIIGNSLVTDKVSEAVNNCKVPVLMLEKQLASPNSLIVRRDIKPAYREIWNDIAPEFYGKTVFCSQENIFNRYDTACECAPPGVHLPLISLQSGKNFAEIRHLTACDARKKIAVLKKYRIFWCSSDLIALGVKDALEEIGLSMGKDFFLIGFDNMEENRNFCSTPVLSTVDSCWEKIGRLSAQMLLDAINGKISQRTVEFRLSYLRRRSFPGFGHDTMQ
ncbi:MAG: LacI family DNA-binding transcriptional regulator [Lentisphaeria bacterium]|nr:LacI family DNA-binding transcriptional regulator [Lentisphaeria bacterium]